MIRLLFILFIYSCEAHNSYVKKSPRSEGGILVVEESSPPRPLAFLPDSPSQEVTAKVGKSAIVPCAVSGIPKPVTVWYHIKTGKKTYII